MFWFFLSFQIDSNLQIICSNIASNNARKGLQSFRIKNWKLVLFAYYKLYDLGIERNDLDRRLDIQHNNK